MKLFHRLSGPWLLSAANAVSGLAATLLIVRLAGPVEFASYTIDLVKLSLLGLMFEIVPSAYVIIRVQQDPSMKIHLASFCLLGMLVTPLVIFGLGQTRVLTEYSPWMLAYGGYLPVQRYLDVKLQAEGRLPEYFLVGLIAGLFRLLLLVVGLVFAASLMAKNDVLWASLGIGWLLALGLRGSRRRHALTPFLRSGHLASLGHLIAARRFYPPYYLNVALKRIRDASITLVSSFIVTDKAELARYLLAFRGLEIVCAQLRVAEALLMNLAARLEFLDSRRTSFVVLSFAGQLAAFLASLLLAGQGNSDARLVWTSFVASLFVYPYVFEMLRRSDAYAISKPQQVTISLLSFIVGLGATIALVRAMGMLNATSLMVAPVVGQTAAAISYLFWARDQASSRR